MNIENKLVSTLGKSIEQATNEELYFSLLTITKELSSEKEVIKTDRKL